MTNPVYQRPLPDIDDPALKPYWEGTRQKQLLIQRCAGCGTFRWYPRPVCHDCWSFDAEWVSVSGLGTIFSYVTVHHAFAATFRSDLPYTVAIVQLDEGVRLPATLKDCSTEAVSIGMPVEVQFEKATDDVTLPYFVPRGGH